MRHMNTSHRSSILKFCSNIIIHLKLQYCGLIGVLLYMMISSLSISAQRVFAPGEDGIMLEIKEGPKADKFGAGRKANYPKLMKTILQEACRIYFYSEDNIEPDEIFVCQPTDVNPLVGKAIFNLNKKGFQINKISEFVYEICPKSNFFKEPKDNNGGGASNKIVIGYNPNKQHKKEGKQPQYWYANFSQLPYDPDDVGNWSKEQALNSISQILSGKKVTEQLFASIKPQPVITQPVINSGQVQYVVVQNQNIVQPDIYIHQNVAPENEQEIVSDIDKNIPYRDIKNENTFALIIANENYNKVATVPFALRDGQKLNEYINNTLGVDKSHISLLEDATLNDMRYELNRLKKISDTYKGDVSFIVYYIGHGIPDEKSGNGYLLPVDGYGNDVTTAYPLDKLYSQLSNINSKRTILVTDACFSGANKSGDMLVAARGVAMRTKSNQAKGNLIAFSACQGDETAYSYDEKGHGLLTYYFLKKLQETGGKTTLGELEEYIVDNVGKTAIVINGKSQTPKVSVSPELKNVWREQTLVE